MYETAQFVASYSDARLEVSQFTSSYREEGWSFVLFHTLISNEHSVATPNTLAYRAMGQCNLRAPPGLPETKLRVIVSCD